MFGRCLAVRGLFAGFLPPVGRTYPASANNVLRFIHRFDRANSVSTWAAFFAKPPVAHHPVAERALDHPKRVLHPGAHPGLQVLVVLHGLFVVALGQLCHRAAPGGNPPHGADDVPPVLSSGLIWSPIPPDQEIGREGRRKRNDPCPCGSAKKYKNTAGTVARSCTDSPTGNRRGRSAFVLIPDVGRRTRTGFRMRPGARPPFPHRDGGAYAHSSWASISTRSMAAWAAMQAAS